jgi:hypothetical protein
MGGSPAALGDLYEDGHLPRGPARLSALAFEKKSGTLSNPSRQHGHDVLGVP